MYSGNTNTGKTVCLMTGLTNLIHSYRDGAFSLYLAMISAKKDLKIFANTKPCKFFAKTIEESYYMFFHLREIMLQRNKMFEGDSTVMNLYDWNKKYKDRQVKPIFVATDEISFYMPTDMDSDDVKDLKNKCRSLMWELLKEGRNCGIHFFSCLQRPDTNSFPAPMKALIDGKVCFYQPNTASSLVVLDSTEATNLRKQREAIVDGEEKLLMKTLYLTPEMIEMHLKDQIEENHKHLNLCNRIESNKENNKEENNVNNDKKHDKSETKNENKATNTANSTKSKEKASSRIKIKK
jgi:hypothetical protein